ncbi:hypothetical protein MVEG_11425 [Podila verticillata NRRL 6337]|uniref:Uncharacterized protein n=1 Tax=Podila verticillata NRRL 6337 TaxID=1069443 RepID=A0A086TLS4_9FUNG|nr:MAG: hypothetical protein BYD32DRAFT_416401 [Podila humilis]KFH62901.1 hypothetical protein MVEG_11425 [Podila verticillata NRRL 6337]
MSNYNVSAGAYQGPSPEDPNAALRRCFTERGIQMDGLGCILRYCQLDSGLNVGDTDLTGFRRSLEGFAGVVNKTKTDEMPRVVGSLMDVFVNVGAFLMFLPEKWQLDKFWYAAIQHADANIAQFVSQDQTNELLLYIVQMNVHINSNTDTSAYILREHYAVNLDEMARRADELVAKVNEKLGIDDWLNRISSEGYAKAGSQVRKETEP